MIIKRCLAFRMGQSFSIVMAVLFALGFVQSWVQAKSKAPKKLIENLKSRNMVKRGEAKRQLRTYRFEEVADAMAEYAKDPNPDIRILMVQTLGELGGVAAAKKLKKIYSKDKVARVRRAILVQLTGLMPDEDEAASF